VGGILIDPIGDTPAGTLLEVSGKTSLPVGTDLLVRVVPVLTSNGRLSGDYQNPENAAVTTVVNSTGTANRFSVQLDTRLLPMADHIVTVSNMQGAAAGIRSEPGTINGTLVFNMIPAQDSAGTAGNDTAAPCIFINPVGTVTAGDPLTVSGITNLPAGSEFRVSAIPAASTDYEHPELAVTTTAVKGSLAGNLFSASLATKGLPAGQHILLISSVDDGITGSILFTVQANR
jgi:hypothetical protein